MKPIYLLIEALWVLGSLGSENIHRMLDVSFLLCCDCGKGFAETSRSGLPNPCIACNSERFEHDLLNDQACDEVALCDRAHECLANPLPIPGFHIVGDNHSDLPAFGSEC